MMSRTDTATRECTLADLRAVPIEGRVVRLEPLTLDHAEEFLAIGQDLEIWQWMADEPPTTLEAVRARIAEEIETAVPFAIRMRRSNAFAGCIEYRSIEPLDESVEVGYLWVGLRFRGTPAAPEAQWLLTKHALDEHGAGRVWLKTDARNKESNASLRRFGVPWEGCLRRHIRMHDGHFRDSNVYAVTLDDWPDLRPRGEAFMDLLEG
jgi:RimJ/RimL family protein N-acetyltransferase